MINLTIKTLLPCELPLLTKQLFKYIDIDNMIKENSDRMKNGEINIFGMFK